MGQVKRSRWVVLGVFLGTVFATVFWFWVMPTRSERLMILQIENISRLMFWLVLVSSVVYYGGYFLIRVAFMERFGLKYTQVPLHRQDYGRIKLLQPFVDQQLTKDAMELDDCFRIENAIIRRSTPDMDVLKGLLEELNEAKNKTGAVKFNFNCDRWIARLMGFLVFDSYREYLPDGKAHQPAA